MSTVVKEYVKEKIAEKYPMKEIPKPFNTEIIRKEIEEATSAIVRSVFEKYADKIAWHKYMGNGVYATKRVEDVTIVGDFNVRNYGSMVDLACEEARDYNKAIEQKRAKVFRDIVVQMELGGTKKDLDELLANLPD
jgi:hypothetical protein